MFEKTLRWLAVAAVLLLAGCNKLKLGYEYADWLIVYTVDENFELDRAQRGRLKEEVGAYFKRHRKELLPQYADLLERAADSLKAGMRGEGVDSGYREYQVLYRKTMEPVIEPAVNLLASLSKKQVEAWAARQKKKNQKLRKDFSGSKDEKLERRWQKTEDELEDWTGRLTPEQKRQVREWSRALPWNGDLWLEKRVRTHERLAALLRKRASREELRAFLEDFYLHPEKLRTEEHNARFQESLLMSKDMVVRVYAILTPEQRRHFISEVEALARSFRNLSKSE